MPQEDVTIVLKAREAISRAISTATGKFSGMGKKIAGSIRGLGQSFGLLRIASAAAMVAMAKDIVMLGIQFESSMIAVKAVAGATALEFERLEATAREMGKTTIFTASQTADAMYDLASAGLEVEEIITALPGVIALAVSQQASLQFATETVTSTLATFGLETREASHVADVFAEAISTSKLNLDKLSLSLAFAGPAAAGFEIGLEETVAGLGAFADLGLRASMIGTTFRMGLIQLTQAMPRKEVKDAAETIEKLGLTFDEVNPSVVGLTGVIENLRETNINMQDAIALFGARAAGPFLKLVKDMNVDLRAQTERLEQANKAVAIMGEVMETTRSSMKEFKSALEEIQIAIFEGLRDPILVATRAWTILARGFAIADKGFGEAAAALAKVNLPLEEQVDLLTIIEMELRKAIDASDLFKGATEGVLKTDKALIEVLNEESEALFWANKWLGELGIEFENAEQAIRFVTLALATMRPELEAEIVAMQAATEATDANTDSKDKNIIKTEEMMEAERKMAEMIVGTTASVFTNLAAITTGTSQAMFDALSFFVSGGLTLVSNIQKFAELATTAMKTSLKPIFIIIEAISFVLRLIGIMRREVPRPEPVRMAAPAGGVGAAGAPITVVNIHGDVLGDGTAVAENIRKSLVDLYQRTSRTVTAGAF